MRSKPAASVKELLSGLILLVGFGVAMLLLWIVAVVVLAGVLYAAMSAFTDWSVGARIGSSLIAAFLTLKVVALVGTICDLIPESWMVANKKTKPCSACGKALRTAMAQQCMHCGERSSSTEH
ncbi:hypothetical protein [Rhodopirellula europaea]|uniref:Signal peptide protein n=1 Tax=Rhodopirellula europaea SH398 TaxID=1263868 RepID=M5SJW0_9BACT|nr:hypothetical protein [Rhodopirellula europaea]EMI26504.1 signal peptide protein [Rhodopirellula europaea SH398]